MKQLDKNLHKEELWQILKLHGITELQFDYIFKFVACKFLKKGDNFSSEGFICKYIAILIEGDLYSPLPYYLSLNL
jgi:hypothetical protein